MPQPLPPLLPLSSRDQPHSTRGDYTYLGYVYQFLYVLAFCCQNLFGKVAYDR